MVLGEKKIPVLSWEKWFSSAGGEESSVRAPIVFVMSTFLPAGDRFAAICLPRRLLSSIDQRQKPEWVRRD